jgi:hypothetical protein
MLPLLVGLTLLWVAPMRAQMSELDWTGPLSAGGWVKVYSGNGAIEITESPDESVHVVAERRGGPARGDRVRFEVLRDGLDIVICSVVDYAECLGDGIRMLDAERSHTPEEVHLSVRLPRSAHVRIATGTGDLSLEGVGGDVIARTGNGTVHLTGISRGVELHSGNGALTIDEALASVRARTGNGAIRIRAASGAVSVRTDNGGIHVGMASLEDGAELAFRTANGGVELDLPVDVSVDLVARLAHGTVISDIPLAMEGRIDFRNLRARIGRGGQELIVVSGDGDLLLRGR